MAKGRNVSIHRSVSSPRRIVIRKVSKPFHNPFIRAEGLNPVRTYEADVMEGKQKKEHLTGVAFANQSVVRQVSHHAMVRGHGQLPVRGRSR
jgi:hypothetical protein